MVDHPCFLHNLYMEQYDTQLKEGLYFPSIMGSDSLGATSAALLALIPSISDDVKHLVLLLAWKCSKEKT